MVRKIHPAEKLPPEDVDELLEFDPLDTAEKITGESCHTDKGTVGLGMLFAMKHNQHKSEVLEARGDTVFSMPLDKYLDIVKDLGFVQVMDVPFQTEHDGKMITEHLLAYWRKGLLLMFDTYGGDHINGGHLYFNWAPTNQKEHVPSSGGCTKDAKGDKVIYGDFDCREALVHHIKFLEARGQILDPWVKQPHLWPIHYGDGRELDAKFGGNSSKRFDEYDKIRQARLAMLPDHVRKAILAKEGEDEE